MFFGFKERVFERQQLHFAPTLSGCHSYLQKLNSMQYIIIKNIYIQYTFKPSFL